MRVHLVAVNFKEKLQAKECVMMLWSYLLFLLLIYGFHITTKEELDIYILPPLFFDNAVRYCGT